MFSKEQPEAKECGNCGSTDGLLRCSRCHTAHYCTAKCQRAHWPFHKPSCRRNEFADAMEDNDQKFATWMRSHGKQAVLKDDEVDRIERAAGAACGTQTREEVIQSMYGRVDPKPEGPTYNHEERKQMAEQAEQDALEERKLTRDQRLWKQIELPEDLGVDCNGYKWRQNQSHIEVFVKLPANAAPKKVTVNISTDRLQVSADGSHLAGGRLRKTVVSSSSTWQLVDGIIEISLLKANRRGRYAPGMTNSDTYWDRVWEGCLESDSLNFWAPTSYYTSPFEDDTVDYAALKAADKDIERERQHALQAKPQAVH